MKIKTKDIKIKTNRDLIDLDISNLSFKMDVGEEPKLKQDVKIISKAKKSNALF